MVDDEEWNKEKEWKGIGLGDKSLDWFLQVIRITGLSKDIATKMKFMCITKIFATNISIIQWEKKFCAQERKGKKRNAERKRGDEEVSTDIKQEEKARELIDFQKCDNLLISKVNYVECLEGNWIECK